ncbi:MAG: hypothetical protein FE78DRAFT_29980 [Acidomyces sp. 'richmondensis']|nr:MAG: hypothetical protein FE78DRAFT_29980 [Acidomyces sp. 'richmondensis']
MENGFHETGWLPTGIQQPQAQPMQLQQNQFPHPYQQQEQQKPFQQQQLGLPHFDPQQMQLPCTFPAAGVFPMSGPSLVKIEKAADVNSPELPVEAPYQHAPLRMPAGDGAFAAQPAFPPDSQPSADGVQQRTERVPLPPNTMSMASRRVASLGPVSTEYEIISRPRPGRKPMDSEHAADRRRLQNRVAQRNFRDKRQQKLMDIVTELEERKKAYEKVVNQLQRDLDRVRQEKKRAVEELTQRWQTAENRVQELEAQMREMVATGSANNPFPNLRIDGRTSGSSAIPPASITTPPEEIDFTNWRSDQTGTHLTNRSNCGFCTDPGNCVCADERQQ